MAEVLRPRAQRAVVGGLGVVTALVVLWPLLSGTVLLLDWAIGARTPIWPRTADGLDGGLTAGLPFHVAAAALAHVTDAAGWLVIAAVFPVGALGTARLVRAGLSGQIASALLYTVNPFVFDRLGAGQIGLLAGYALLPWATKAALAPGGPTARDEVRRASLVALWWAVLTGCSVHFAWIFGLVVLARAARPSQQRRTLGLVAAAGALAVSSLYLVLPARGQSQAISVGTTDLVAYRTQPDPHVGLLGNLLGLYGFWRRGPELPQQALHAWWLVLLLLLAVCAVGVRAALHDSERRIAMWTVIGPAIVGLCLAMGDQGPTGPAFRFLFDHVGPFQVMREPQKFICLLALAYSVLFGWGAETLWLRAGSRPVLAWSAPLVFLLPIAYTPTIVYGLHDQIRGSHVPASFSQANRLMGDGPESVLFLPWHQYEGFPWSDGITSNPGQLFFDRPTIVGDDVELPQVQTTSTFAQSRYLEYLYASAKDMRCFGALIAPLGVKYVVIAKTVDWQSYGWLDKQSDLDAILDTPDLTVYVNRAAVDVGHRVPQLRSVEDWGSLIALGNAGQDLGDVQVRHAVPGPIARPQVVAGAARGPVARRTSLTTLEVPAGDAGYVVSAEPYAADWRAPGGGRPVDLGDGAMALPMSSSAGTIRFEHRTQAWVGELASLAALCALLALAVSGRAKRIDDELRHWDARSSRNC